MRSLIQLAGRIRRHRPGTVERPNLLTLDCNLRHFERPNKPAYCKPGFEMDAPASGWNLTRLRNCSKPGNSRSLTPALVFCQKPDDALQPTKQLVDLEHARIEYRMRPQSGEAELSSYQRRKGVMPAPPINATTRTGCARGYPHGSPATAATVSLRPHSEGGR